MNRDLTPDQAYSENVIRPTLDAIRRADEEQKKALVRAIAQETQRIAEEMAEFMPAFGIGEE